MRVELVASGSFSRHDVVWTRETSARFWEFIASQPAYEDQYFSKARGDSLLDFVEAAGVPLRGRTLDFGCGLGYLLERLLRRGIGCEGIDFSDESVRRARERLALYGDAVVIRQIGGIPAAEVPAASVDTIFLVETLEHLPDADLESVVGEVYRIAKPGGFVVVTTPNDEKLEESKVICPECGGVFHRMQHLRSFTAQSLSAELTRRGFETVLCEAVYFTEATVWSRLRVAAVRLLRRKMPHLIYIGRKPRCDR